jgi:serine phosphatase RsbU (regulator of sigma subunit)
LTDPSTGGERPAPHAPVPHRKSRPKPFLKRWEIIGLLTGFVLLAAGLLLQKTAVDGNIPGLLLAAGALALAVVLAALCTHLIRLLAGVLFHKVRNRIIANYLLTGVLPLLLVLLLVVSVFHFFMVQLAGSQLKHAIEREYIRLEAAALLCSTLPSTAGDGASSECLDHLEREYPGFRLFIPDVHGAFPGTAAESMTPALIADSVARLFLVLDDTVYMAVSIPTGDFSSGRPLVLAVPLQGRVLSALGDELGGNCMFSYGFHTGREAVEEETGAVRFRLDAGTGGSAGVRFSQSPDLQTRIDRWSHNQPGGPDHLISYSLNPGYMLKDDGTIQDVMVLGLVSTRHSYLAGRIMQGALPENIPMQSVFLWVALILAAVFGAIELVALVISLVLSRSITKTIAQLHKKADCVARGDFSYRIGSGRTDQLGLLAASFDAMSDSLELLLEQVREKERIEHELEIAQEVQRVFFPRSFPDVRGISLLGRCRPALMVSGDYYDFIHHEEGVLDFFIGDICGKGISAALLMAGSQTFLRSEAGRRPLRPVTGIVDSFNNYLVRYSAEGRFSSLFYGRLDPVERTLTYCNAGHPAPFLFRRGKVTTLSIGGLIPGVVPATRYGEETIRLEQDDLIVAFTDGFTEAFNPEDQEFGETRLSETVSACQMESLEAICDRMVNTVDTWSAARVQADDMTVFLARVR